MSSCLEVSLETGVKRWYGGFSLRIDLRVVDHGSENLQELISPLVEALDLQLLEPDVAVGQVQLSGSLLKGQGLHGLGILDLVADGLGRQHVLPVLLLDLEPLGGGHSRDGGLLVDLGVRRGSLPPGSGNNGRGLFLDLVVRLVLG